MKKTKKANIYDYVLSMFNSTNILRPKLCKVGKQENFLFATDSHSLIRVPDSLSKLDYQQDEDPVNYLAVFPKENDHTFTIDRDFLLSELTKAKLIWKKEFKDCEECNGKGEVECPCCDNESECNDCDGTGESNILAHFSNIELKGNVISFAGTSFSSTYLNKVLQASYFLEQKKITVKAYKDCANKPVVFELGEVQILLMPCLNP